MSFVDNNGNAFSALFDSLDSLNSILKTIVACQCHIASHLETTSEESLKRLLPRLEAESPDDAVVSLSTVLGVRLIVWEIGDLADYPNEIFSNGKLLDTQNDLVKLK